jgi:hypothetical protein
MCSEAPELAVRDLEKVVVAIGSLRISRPIASQSVFLALLVAILLLNQSKLFNYL